MQRAAPSPSGAGAVTWCASEFAAYPANSARMGAPRCLAHESSSRITTPAPSPVTNPSRSRSNGRLARWGSAFLVESAFIAAKPPMLIGVIVASDPPAIAASVSPTTIDFQASPMACADEAQAEAGHQLGPLAPYRMLTRPAAMLMS